MMINFCQNEMTLFRVYKATFCQNKGLVDLAQVYEQLLWKLIKKGLIDLAQVYEQLLAKSKSMVKKS